MGGRWNERPRLYDDRRWEPRDDSANKNRMQSGPSQRTDETKDEMRVRIFKGSLVWGGRRTGGKNRRGVNVGETRDGWRREGMRIWDTMFLSGDEKKLPGTARAGKAERRGP